jgi:hypothetical protein
MNQKTRDTYAHIVYISDVMRDGLMGDEEKESHH